jgi:predicted ribosome quality control (RQC) complex YloA/Tae2 family protein
MKKELASLEILRIVTELKERITNAKFNKIYIDFERLHNTRREVFFEFHVPNKGRQMLHIILPNFIFMTDTKPEMPTTPGGFCTYLRKYLTSARILEIEQCGVERIIKISIDARTRETEPKPVVYHMYIELFSKGNIILTNAEDIILSPLEIQKWSERTVRPKEKYMYPRTEFNIHKMKEPDFIKALELSAKESVVKTLAIDCALGGLYAEEICSRAGVDKDTKKVTKQDAKKIYAAFTILRKEIKTGPAYIIRKDEMVINILPCKIEKYKEEINQENPSFVDALNIFLAPQVQKKAVKQKKSEQKNQLSKLKTMIKSQEKQIVQCEETHIKNQKIGEAIYENFQRVEEILKQLTEARKTKSWKEIKKAAKDHKIIKQINEKNKEIVIEI